MNYQIHYDNLIARAKNRLLEGYVENHHVIPKCLGGTDDDINLVELTAEEHFMAHKLLMKIYPTHYGLSCAVLLMSGNPHGYRNNNKLYGWARKCYIKSSKGRNKENCESIRRQAEALTGRTAKTHEYLAIMASKKRTLNKENCEGVRRQAEKMTGRTAKTHEGLAKMAAKKRGRTKGNHEGTRRQSETMTGRTVKTHEGVAKMSETKNKLPIKIRKELIMRRNSGDSYIAIYDWIISLGYSISKRLPSVIYNRDKHKFDGDDSL